MMGILRLPRPDQDEVLDRILRDRKAGTEGEGGK